MKKAFPILFRGVRSIASNQTSGLVDKTRNDDKLAPCDAGVKGIGIRKNHSWASLSTLQEKPPSIDLESIKKAAANTKLTVKEDKEEEVVDKIFLNALQVFKDLQNVVPIQPILKDENRVESTKKSVTSIKLLPKKEKDGEKLDKRLHNELQKSEIVNELTITTTNVKNVETEKNVIPPDKTPLEKTACVHLKAKKSDVTKESLFNSAVYYEKKEKYAKALVRYVKAGKMGCKEGYFRASLIYEWGKGSVKQDTEAADELLSLSALLGHRIARHNVAAKLLNKKNTPLAEEILATFFLQKNIEEGVAKSMNFLGHRLLTKNKSADDLKQAVQILSTAAEQNYAPSLYNLAICYLEGIGVSKPDKKRAYELLVKASNLNDVASIKKVADMLEEGDAECGIARDKNEAARLRDKALNLDVKSWRKQLMNDAFRSAGYKSVAVNH